jgi:hypothetical protein
MGGRVGHFLQLGVEGGGWKKPRFRAASQVDQFRHSLLCVLGVGDWNRFVCGTRKCMGIGSRLSGESVPMGHGGV